jgi:hypothetical protein
MQGIVQIIEKLAHIQPPSPDKMPTWMEELLKKMDDSSNIF